MAEYTVIVIRCEVGDCQAGLRYEWATKRSATLAARQLGWFVKSHAKTRCPRCVGAEPPRTYGARFDAETATTIAYLYETGPLSTYRLGKIYGVDSAVIARAVVRGGGTLRKKTC